MNDVGDDAFERAKERHKIERRALVVTAFIILILDVGEVTITGASMQGIQATIHNWDFINKWILTSMLVWFILMYTQSVWNLYSVIGTFPIKGSSNTQDHPYIGGIKKSYQETIHRAQAVWLKRNKAEAESTNSKPARKAPWHVTFFAVISFILTEQKISFDLIPLFAALAVLCHRVLKFNCFI